MEKREALSTKPEECRYSFFQHTACEFFPCHETAHPEDFNCLFCPSAAPSSCPTGWTSCRRSSRRSASTWTKRPSCTATGWRSLPSA